jgi:hypothetical protein
MGKTSQTQLEKNLCATLSSSSAHPGKRDTFHIQMEMLLQRAHEADIRVHVVGGALRNLLLDRPNSEPRDLDIIVENCSAKSFKSLFCDLAISTTSFGGLRLQYPRGLARRMIDIWRIEETWAIKRFHKEPTIDSFLGTPFLNIDAVTAEASHESPNRWHVRGAEFFRAIIEKTLRINFEPNPYPLVCALRTVSLAMKYQFRLETELARFTLTQLKRSTAQERKMAQFLHYGKVLLSPAIIAETTLLLQAHLAQEDSKNQLFSLNIRHPTSDGIGEDRMMKSRLLEQACNASPLRLERGQSR